MIKFLKRTIGSWLPSLVAALIVSASLANADSWAPFGLSLTGVATTQASCTDLGAGLNVLSNTLLCLSGTIAEPETFSAAGTAVAITNNATVGGTLGVTGTLTTGVQNGSGLLTLSGAGTALSVTNNATIGGTLGVTGTTTTAAINSSGTHTISSASALALNSDQTTNTTGVTLNSVATGVLDATHPEFAVQSTNTTAATHGCPDTGLGSTNQMFQLANSANTAHGISVLCSGNVTVGGAVFAAAAINASGVLTFSGAAPQVNLGSASGGEIDSPATSGIGMLFKDTGGSGMNNSAVNFEWFGNNNTTNLMQLTGAGNLTLAIGDYKSSSGNLQMNSVAAGNSEILLNNATAVGGALGSGSVVFGGTGIIANSTTCSLALPANGSSTAMTNGISCLATTNAANTASAFIIAFQNTYNTAPNVQVQPGTVDATGSAMLFPIITAISTSSFTVTWVNNAGTATAPGNSKTFWFTVTGGK